MATKISDWQKKSYKKTSQVDVSLGSKMVAVNKTNFASGGIFKALLPFAVGAGLGYASDKLEKRRKQKEEQEKNPAKIVNKDVNRIKSAEARRGPGGDQMKGGGRKEREPGARFAEQVDESTMNEPEISKLDEGAEEVVEVTENNDKNAAKNAREEAKRREEERKSSEEGNVYTQKDLDAAKKRNLEKSATQTMAEFIKSMKIPVAIRAKVNDISGMPITNARKKKLIRAEIKAYERQLKLKDMERKQQKALEDNALPGGGGVGG